ncbi:MAG: hypothetical protein A3K09_01495, partial [Nitrospinae bacterium RIFCSPLOWO2_12_FULL_47_7]
SSYHPHAYSTYEELEKNHFLRYNANILSNKELYKNNIKNKISKVMSSFKTGLDESSREKVPNFIVEQSQKYDFDPLFLTALIITESSFYNQAESDQGAMGLMQIQPDTGVSLASETQVQWNGKHTLYNPSVNIALGTYYLSKLVSRYGDLDVALEAYNHGPTKLDSYQRNGYRPQGYSRRVLRLYYDLKSQTDA